MLVVLIPILDILGRPLNKLILVVVGILTKFYYIFALL